MLRPSLVSCTRRANNTGIKKCTLLYMHIKYNEGPGLSNGSVYHFWTSCQCRNNTQQWSLHFRFCILTFPLGQPFFDGHPLITLERGKKPELLASSKTSKVKNRYSAVLCCQLVWVVLFCIFSPPPPPLLSAFPHPPLPLLFF